MTADVSGEKAASLDRTLADRFGCGSQLFGNLADGVSEAVSQADETAPGRGKPGKDSPKVVAEACRFLRRRLGLCQGFESRCFHHLLASSAVAAPEHQATKAESGNQVCLRIAQLLSLADQEDECILQQVLPVGMRDPVPPEDGAQSGSGATEKLLCKALGGWRGEAMRRGSVGFSVHRLGSLGSLGHWSAGSPGLLGLASALRSEML